MIAAGGHALETERIDAGRPDRPTLVFLHEGLGSIAMWRDFPRRLAQATKCNALVYSRHGYGRSEQLENARAVTYMHDEALIVLPELLDRLQVTDPLLVGHSDGASIALIHAGSGIRPVRALIVMAPHVMVEDISISSIAAAKQAFAATDLPQRLSRYHDHVATMFWGWNHIWLDPAFRSWNIEEYLAGIACPVLAIQGDDDEYGTMEQVRRIANQVRGAEVLTLNDCRHSPHRDQQTAVIEAIVQFVQRLPSSSPAEP